MNFTPTNAEVYFGISISHYDIFHRAYNEIKEMIGNNESFDLLSHTEEEISKYYQLEQMQRQSMMICIVFQAFAIEAFVNLIAVNLYDESEFFGAFEEMATMKKIKKIFSEKLKSDFLRNKEVYELVEKTFNLRDKLAHFKSKKIDLKALQDDPTSYDPFELLYDCYGNIDDSVKSYPKFKELVDSLIGHDIFEKQKNDLQEMMVFNIKEILRKAFGLNKGDSDER